VFSRAAHTAADSDSRIVIEQKREYFATAFAGRLCEVVCEIGIGLTISQHLISDVGLTIAIPVLATLPEHHRPPSSVTNAQTIPDAVAAAAARRLPQRTGRQDVQLVGLAHVEETVPDSKPLTEAALDLRSCMGVPLSMWWLR
jgi:hypothetical protein